MKKRYLLFDIDGTLINTGGAGLRAMNAAAAEVLGTSCLPVHYSFAGKTDTRIMGDLLRAAGIEDRRQASIRARLNKAYESNLKGELRGAERFMVYPHVREFLSLCRSRTDCELALLTGNLQQGARLKLEHADLWKHFAWGVFGEVSEDRVHLAQAACATISKKSPGINPKSIFIIGDTTHDVRCGKAIGATTIAFASGFEPEELLRKASPDFIIHDFQELPALVFA